MLPGHTVLAKEPVEFPSAWITFHCRLNSGPCTESYLDTVHLKSIIYLTVISVTVAIPLLQYDTHPLVKENLVVSFKVKTLKQV